MAPRSSVQALAPRLEEALIALGEGESESDGFRRAGPVGRPRLARCRPGAGTGALPAAGDDPLHARLYRAGRSSAQRGDRRRARHLVLCALRSRSRSERRSEAEAATRQLDRREAQGRRPASTTTASSRASSTSSRRWCGPISSSATPTGAARQAHRLSNSRAAGSKACRCRSPFFEIFVYSPRVEGRASALRPRGARRHPLVRPAAGFPHRDPGPRQGAAGEERGDRAGRRQGRLLPEAPAAGNRSATPGCRGHRELQARSSRRCSTSPTTSTPAASCSRRRRCATTATTPIWWSRPTRARPPSRTSPTPSPRPRHHWLGDAFASGGSQGYDHKEMGITARGAWEAVKRHFREIDIDIQTTPFTVCGVGDMSGDVFGNGMLLSEHIRLVAAFDHRDIFLDPEPDAERALGRAPAAVRSAALELEGLRPRDHLRGRRGLLRAAEGHSALAARCAPLSASTGPRPRPSEVMQRDPQGAVDLLWFGGIGTYVRAAIESDDEVGDRANDAIRITGAAAARQGRRRGRQSRRDPARPHRGGARGRAPQHRRHRQFGRRQHLRRRGELQDRARERHPRAAAST